MTKQSIAFIRNISQFLAGFVLIFLFAIFLTPQASAAKPCWDADHNKIPCGPQGSPIQQGDPSLAALSGEFLDFSLRSCDSEANPLDIRGNYTCSSGEDIGVCVVGLGEPVASRKSLSWMCNVFQLDRGHLYLSLASWVYGWTDSCGDGDCGIEVRLVSNDPLISTLTYQKSDSVEITLFTHAYDLTGAFCPFHETLDLDIDSIEIDFKKTGSTRTAVICNYDLTNLPDVINLSSLPD